MEGRIHAVPQTVGEDEYLVLMLNGKSVAAIGRNACEGRVRLHVAVSPNEPCLDEACRVLKGRCMFVEIDRPFGMNGDKQRQWEVETLLNRVGIDGVDVFVEQVLDTQLSMPSIVKRLASEFAA
jgi:hypothetical protein